MPDNPRAWLVSTGRFKAIDAIRRRSRHARIMRELSARVEAGAQEAIDPPDVVDDRLRLIFTCCHPAISMEAQIALTLRESMRSEDGRYRYAFLTTTATLAQRMVRAKSKIRDAKIPLRCRRGNSCPSVWTRCCMSSI